MLAIVAVGINGAIAAKSSELIGQPAKTEVELAGVSRHSIVEKVIASGMISPKQK